MDPCETLYCISPNLFHFLAPFETYIFLVLVAFGNDGNKTVNLIVNFFTAVITRTIIKVLLLLPLEEREVGWLKLKESYYDLLLESLEQPIRHTSVPFHSMLFFLHNNNNPRKV